MGKPHVAPGAWRESLNAEVRQFTYFQQVGGIDCNPHGEITMSGAWPVNAGRDNATTDMDRWMSYGVCKQKRSSNRLNFEHSDAVSCTAYGHEKLRFDGKHGLPAYEQSSV